MTDWHEKLKQHLLLSERVELISQLDCPESIIKFMVTYDTEEEVILAGLSHPSCNGEIDAIGTKRLKEFKKGSDTLCPIMWNHMGIQQNSDLRQCCQMIHKPFGKFFDDDGNPLNFSSENIDIARNHPTSKQIRKEMMEGKKPEACKLCWIEEDVGITSKRINMIKKFRMTDMLANTDKDGTIDLEKVSLNYLDLRLGNLCNLRCRSCGPGDSSLWIEDFAEIHKKTENATLVPMSYYGEKNYNLVKQKGLWKIDSDDFEWYADKKFHVWMDEKILNGLAVIYFTGGEPTVNKHHMKILERIIDLKKAQYITLEYNSNMVAIPPRLLELWKHFKLVQIGASIDAIGPLATYVRNPSKWDEVEKNCDKIGYHKFHNMHIGLSTTISVFNVLHFIDVTKWLLSKKYTTFKRWPSWHVLEGPAMFSIQTLPKETKEHIGNVYQDFYKWVDDNLAADSKFIRVYYNSIINFMNKEQKQHLLPLQKQNIERMDSLRKESIETAVPWLFDILKNV